MDLGTRIWHPEQVLRGADDIITNLAKERESGIEIIERTPNLNVFVTPKVMFFEPFCSENRYRF